METSHIILTVLAIIAVAIFLFALMKGVIKMVLLALAVSGAVASWMFLQKNGFTYVEKLWNCCIFNNFNICAWIFFLNQRT